MSEVKIFLAEGFEELEAVAVIDILRRAQISIQIVSLSDVLKVKGSRNIEIMADELFQSANFDDVSMIILPGGNLGTKNLKKHLELNDLILNFCKQNKYVAAICAAPSVLGVKGLLDGRHAVCYPGVESALKGAIIGNNAVEVDNNIITSKGPGTAIEFALKLIEVLKDKDMSNKIGEDLVLC